MSDSKPLSFPFCAAMAVLVIALLATGVIVITLECPACNGGTVVYGRALTIRKCGCCEKGRVSVKTWIRLKKQLSELE